ncbi:hypothetical protein ATE80_23940 [Streptomyces kanasensis]|uniref:Uncharacterized protein n=1 Tax=Streptomyces kanasensis TaxID=936756 RepID=A0A100Y2A1_9ACTN|nr:hypothetical protein ATE80_23940 [Streptomyces kanasensis]
MARATRTHAHRTTSGPGSQGRRVSGATTQRGPSPLPRTSGGTVTASPRPWQSSGGTASPHSSQPSREGSRWLVPGAVNSSIRPWCAATGPEPGPSSHSRSRRRRPKTAGTFTTSKTEPQGSTAGAVGWASHRERVVAGYAEPDTSHSAPSAVIRVAWCGPSPPGCGRTSARRSSASPWTGLGGVSSRNQVLMPPVYRR